MKLHRSKLRKVKPTAVQTSVTVEDAKQRVLQALEDPRYRFRTLRGISKSARVTPEQAMKVISEASGKVVVAARRSTEGETLYASRKRYEDSASLTEKVMGVLFNRVY